ncbi:hypothetical protein GobsT_43690 [Gemmata obscuriglobus]|nr:hypothetical protein GobsT_43690 [Gemmata obscuriglobus]VTS08823.1 unnamed protein product [Gemmata obscuriglobus UQM 2246]
MAPPSTTAAATSRGQNVAPPVSTEPIPSNARAAWCSFVWASTRIWPSTAAAGGHVPGHPVRARHVPAPAPAQALAVQGHMRAGVRGQAARDPPAQGRLQLLGGDPPQGPGQGRRGRRLTPPEPARVSQRGPVLAPEPGDPLEARAAHPHRQRDQPEDRRQRVDPALQPARVGDR